MNLELDRYDTMFGSRVDHFCYLTAANITEAEAKVQDLDFYRRPRGWTRWLLSKYGRVIGDLYRLPDEPPS